MSIPEIVHRLKKDFGLSMAEIRDVTIYQLKRVFFKKHGSDEGSPRGLDTDMQFLQQSFGV